MSCLVADLGGTRIKLGILESGRLLARNVIPADQGEPITDTMDRLGGNLERLCEEVGVKPEYCLGFSAGFPALVDSTNNRVLNQYGKYQGAAGFDFNHWTERRWGIPAVLENDARMALVGEWQFGAGRGTSRLAIITIGTGIGTAVLLDGSPLRGTDFSEGNLCGHWQVNSDGYPCSCGTRGCIEAETGSRNLPERVRDYLKSLGRDSDRSECPDYRTLLNLSNKGAEWARAMVDEALSHWSYLCARLSSTFDLDRVIVGGGVMHSIHSFLPAMEEQANQLLAAGRTTLEIRPAAHPDSMALLAGEWLLKEKLQA